MKTECTFKDEIIKDQMFGERNQYQCYVESTLISKPNVEVSAFLGKHLEEKSDKDVKRLNFVHTDVKYLPRGISQVFVNLKELNIWNCKLKEVTREDFVGFQNLTSLHLDNNELVSLPSDLLEDMKNLTTIRFCERKLKFVDSKMLEPLKHQLICFVLESKENIKLFYHRCFSSLKFEEVMKVIDEKFAKPRQVDSEKYVELVKELWETRQYSDFTIKVEKNLEKKEIKVHKAVLGPQSSVFAAMFEINMDEKRSSEMTINEFSSSAVEEFFEFFYTDHVPDERNAMEIFELAAKYDVEKLKIEMEGIIVANIDDSNALEVLGFGNLHGSEKIMSAAFQRVKAANPEFRFADHLKFKPDDIRALIKAKKQLDQDIEDLRKKYNQDLNDIQKKYNELEITLNFK